MKLLSSALAGSALLILSGCVTPESAANSKPGDNTTAGTIMGGLIGAIAGMEMSSKGDRKKGAIVGAIVGAAAGNAIGQSLDEQAADLRRDLNNNQVNVTNTGSELIVTMPQDILFALDSAAVRSDLRRDLGVVAGNLQAYPNSTISIEGHTDNTGTANYNRILSQRRANAVADILVNNGVPPARLYAVGRGENEPVASNLSATGRAQNRRVEIVIRPNA
ncbi:MAG: OmpA family protein [Planktomarina temperata]|jgi:outer membrane protein OmpA-like peptidoglycan-associated protein|uniref:OmpA family protein n=2 Tax=Paracoccaceae TaxID=31989 RepID=UPI0023043BD1|nr:OmpA family protein [Planktomarina temperata]MDA9899096.1 OmpA family protein [Planktomarina temperata]MDB0019200.1 OmpA family protein [Planktomarina temperata]MDB2334242.1 OmpA family protein [Planktomarina temperata]MDB2458597.1 OmpA family protein [Planktomarina temperata]